MSYLSLSCFNFRNIQNGTIDLSSREVYFVGENGQGKSNLLECLYYVAYGNSFRTHNDGELITAGEKETNFRAIYKDNRDHVSTVSVYLQDGKKKIEKNAKTIHDRKELVNTIPTVLFCHDDLDFASGSPERRRFFVDQSLSMYDNSYIDVSRQFKKILKTRNIILKEKKNSLIDVVDAQFVESAIEIMKRRKTTILSFNRVFTPLYAEISGIDNVKIDYVPSWKKETIDDAFNALVEKRTIDFQYGMSMSGPHRDNIKFMRNGCSFVPTASTGQRRLLSLLLRAAQAKFFTEISGKKPVLLMDDVLLELDPDKRAKFSNLLPEYDQLFCTFLPGEPYERYKKTTTRVYSLNQGTLSE